MKLHNCMKPNIKDVRLGDWGPLFDSLGFRGYAARQVFRWLYKEGATSFDQMTNISREGRKILTEKYSISRLKSKKVLAGKDGTKKFLFELGDSREIEAVLIPTEKGRVTLCISSQVGCSLGCRFCRTAAMGIVRDLTVSEIVGQVLGIVFSSLEGREAITNVVFMGMGEPLNNYENVRESIRILTDANGMAFAKRRVTLSTAGVLPGIERMIQDKLDVNLAISLNATTDEIRQEIMPIAKIYSIDRIIDACRRYHPPGGRRRTTFEYILIEGLNDSIDDAGRLAALMSRLPSKVNLIPLNPFPGCRYREPKEEVLKSFYNYLYNKHIQVNIRKGRGREILAACGQLASGSND